MSDGRAWMGSDGRAGAASSTSIAVPASTSELSSLRHRVAAFARDTGGDDTVAESLELAVSELATNVIRHTAAAEIRVMVHRAPTRWVLDVTGADDLELPVEIPMPPRHPAAGRGLFVTQSVMDSVATVAVDGHRVVRCTKLAG
jgi:serine/threonine-protein kinase RsbW